MTETYPTHSRLRVIAALFAATVATIVAALLGAGGASAASSGGLGTGTSGGGERPDPQISEKYDRMWMQTVTARERRWANRVAECESGRDPDAIGGGGRYRGAFQFTKETWKRSPKSPGGDPVDYSYRTQGVVAVMLKRREGSSPWPVCG